MSVQRDCLIFKANDSKWYMLLARKEHGDLDEADHFGPFGSLEEVEAELDKHSNPGGSMVDKSGTRMPNGRKMKGAK